MKGSILSCGEWETGKAVRLDVFLLLLLGRDPGDLVRSTLMSYTKTRSNDLGDA